jgi:hypothetical protein
MDTSPGTATSVYPSLLRFIEKSACPPCCESPLKLQPHQVRLLTIWKQITNGAHRSPCGPFIYDTQLLAMAL